MNSLKQPLSRTQIESQFDRAASTYDDVAAVQQNMANNLLQRVIRESTISMRLLDLGCGTGQLLTGLSDAGFQSLHGLDLSANMIDIARSKCPSADYLHAAIESIPVDDGTFDVLTSNAALQWCDPIAAATEMARVLRPGGTVFLNTFVQGTLRQWVDAFAACEIESRVHQLPASAEIEQALTAAGFEELQLQRVTETSTFQSISSMLNSIRRLGASNASESRKRPILKREYRLLKQFFDRRLANDGKLELDFVWVELRTKLTASFQGFEQHREINP